MAFELSRIDRLTKTYPLAVRFPELDGPFTAADVALLSPRTNPTAATVWQSVTVTTGVATVLFAGPDADSSGAVVVTGSADLWMRVADSPEVDAVKIERIVLLGGGTVAAALPLPQVASVAGLTGAITAQSIADALNAGSTGVEPTGGAGGALSGTYPSPGLNVAAVDTSTAANVNDSGSNTAAALRAAYASYLTLAANPDTIIAGTITRDSNGAATSAPVVWPDGSPGTYTATTVSSAFPGAVDAYTITYGSPVTRTYTQAAVTRDTNGAVTQRPALTVS